MWLNGIMSYSPILAFLSAATFNLFNYWYQLFEMNEVLNGSFKNAKIIDVFLILVQGLYLLIFIVLTVFSWAIQADYSTIGTIFSSIFSTLYLIMWVMFPTVSYLFYKKLKEISWVKAKVLKNRIIWSALIISIPFFLRGAYNLVKIPLHIDEEFEEKSLEKDNFKFPIFILFYHTTVDILPMIFQMVLVKWVIDHYRRRLNSMNPSNFAANITEKESIKKSNVQLENDYKESVTGYDHSFKDTFLFESLVESTRDARD